MAEIDWGTMLLALAASLAAGGAIGLDREFMGRAAGLRTHMMVALASALLMLAATHQSTWTIFFLPGTDIVSDPTRMAHGVLTGIGFLGAGVIFREGPSVHGLTTATSLWMAASLGLLAGAGLWWLTLAGTLATLLVLVLLRLLTGNMHRVVTDIDIQSREEAGLTVDAIVAALQDETFDVVRSSIERGGDGLTMHRLQVKSPSAMNVDRLAAILCHLPGTTSVGIRPHD